MDEKQITSEEVVQISKKILERDMQEGISLDVDKFVDLLKHSLSLTVSEKKRVLDSTPKLSQFQFDSLIWVFEEERVKFKDLMKKHPEEVTKLVTKQQAWWLELGEIYKQLEVENEATSEEWQKIDDIKASLWL